MRRRSAPRAGTAGAAAGGPGRLLEATRAEYGVQDVLLIERAYECAARLHEGQRRRSGEAYITHPVAVAMVAVQLRLRPALVCAALLHDVLEDTPCSPAELYAQFGSDVADLVVAFASFDHDVRLNDEPRCGEAEVHYPADVLRLKVLDRLHNMRTIRYVPVHRQYAKSRQTRNVIAPLAAALGMDAISSELEELANAVLHPEPHRAGMSSWVLGTTTLVLPAAARPRWRKELTAELLGLPTRSARARFVFQMLLGAPRLAVTLRRPITPT